MTATLGWIGSALVVLAVTQRDLRRLYQFNLAAAFILLTFNVIVGIGSMIALNVVLAAVNGYQLVARSRRRPDAPSSAPPEPTHVLDVSPTCDRHDVPQSPPTLLPQTRANQGHSGCLVVTR